MYTKYSRATLVLLLALVGFGCSLYSGVHVSLTAPTIVEAKSLVTLTAHIENSGEEKESYELDVQLPKGWEMVSALRPLSVAGGKSRKKPITISVPLGASAAEIHVLFLTIRSLESGEETKVVRELQVAPEFGVGLRLLQRDELEWMGKWAVQRYEIRNTGNSLCSFGIEVRSSRPWSLQVPKYTSPLAPGETYPLEVRVYVPPTANDGEKNYLTLEVWPEHPACSRERHAEIYRSTIEAIVPQSREETVYPTLPATFELKAFDIAQSKLPKLRPRLRSRGVLDDRYLVDMDLSTTAFREFDQDRDGSNHDYYRLDVENPECWAVSVGNTRADFSYLTQDLFGTGARLQGHGKDWEAQVFYGERTVSSSSDLEELSAGARVSVLHGDHYGVGATFLGIREESNDTSAAIDVESVNLSTLGAFLRPCSQLILEGECGLCHLELPAQRHNDHAWWVLGTYTPSRWLIETEVYRSGTYYKAKLNDRKGLRCYGAYHWDDSTLWAELHNYHNNIADDPTLKQLHTKRNRIGCYFPECGVWPSIDSNAEYRKELSYAADEQLDEESYLLNLTLNKNWEDTILTARGRWDYTLERITDEKSHLQLYELYGRSYVSLWTLGYGAYLNLSSKHLEQINDYRLEGWFTYPLKEWGTLMGKAICTWKQVPGSDNSYAHWAEWGYLLTRDCWYLDVRLRHNLLESDELLTSSTQANTQLIAQGVYTLSPWQALEAYVEYNRPQAQGREWRTVITWKKDFNLPVVFMRTKAILRGRLIVDGKCEETSLSKIRVALGTHAVHTDRQGRFSFPPLPPGSYLLRVDTAQLPTSLAIVDPMPLEVTLQKGEDRFLALPVVTVASVGGRVFVDVDKGGESSDAEEGMKDVRILLKRGDQVIAETFSSPKGNYRFHNVTPGSYHVWIDLSYLPKRYVLSTPQERHFELEPKQQLREIDFGVYEQERRVKVRKF